MEILTFSDRRALRDVLRDELGRFFIGSREVDGMAKTMAESMFDRDARHEPTEESGFPKVLPVFTITTPPASAQIRDTEPPAIEALTQAVTDLSDSIDTLRNRLEEKS